MTRCRKSDANAGKEILKNLKILMLKAQGCRLNDDGDLSHGLNYAVNDTSQAIKSSFSLVTYGSSRQALMRARTVTETRFSLSHGFSSRLGRTFD